MERRRHDCDGVAAYKALLPGTYGCGEEEAGGLTLLSEAPGGSLLTPAVQVSNPSREGHIIGMRMLLSQATQRRKR